MKKCLYALQLIASRILFAVILAVFTPAIQMARAATIYDSFNTSGVYNGPKVATVFSVTSTVKITNIMTYHYNNGSGSTPGTISLKHSDGTVYGPWTATGYADPNYFKLFWNVYPDAVIKPGSYTVIDSGTATWSYNSASGNAGFVLVKGDVVTASTYTISTAASPTAGGSVTCSPNPVSSGSNSTCTATANSGYTFAGWSGDCTGASSTCTLSNVTALKSVTALFSVTISTPSQAFDVTASAGGDTSSLTLDLFLNVNSADIGTQGSIYLGAQVPVSATQDAWFFNNSAKWINWTGGTIPAFFTGILPAGKNFAILRNGDARTLANVKLYAGYGRDANDMLNRNNAKLAYTLPTATVNTVDNMTALTAIADVSQVQEDAYAELLLMFSAYGTKPLFDGSVNLTGKDYDTISQILQKILAKQDQYEKAMSFLESAATATSGKSEAPRSGRGLISAIGGLFKWAIGTSVTARSNVLTIFGKLDTEGRTEAYGDAVDKYGTAVVGNSPAEFEQILKSGKLDNRAFELNKTMTNSLSPLYHDAAKDLGLTIDNIAVKVAAEGIEAGTDVLVQTVAAAVPGSGEGISIAEKAIKTVNQPESVLEGQATSFNRGKTGMDLISTAAMAKKIVKFQTDVKIKSGKIKRDDALKAGRGEIATVIGNTAKGTKPPGIAATTAKNKDTGQVIVAAGTSVYTQGGTHNVLTIADNTKDEMKNTVISNPDVVVTEGAETVVAVNYPFTPLPPPVATASGEVAYDYKADGTANAIGIKYTISGGSSLVRTPVGNTSYASYSGRLVAGSTLTIAGSGWSVPEWKVSMTSFDKYPMWLEANVTVDGNAKDYKYYTPKGESMNTNFSLSVPIPSDATNGSFKVLVCWRSAYRDQCAQVSGYLSR